MPTTMQNTNVSLVLIGLAIVFVPIASIVWVVYARLKQLASELATAEGLNEHLTVQVQDARKEVDATRTTLQQARAAMVVAQTQAYDRGVQLDRLQEEIERVKYGRDCALDALDALRDGQPDQHAGH